MPPGGGMMTMMMHTPDSERAFDVDVYRGSLPDDARLFVAFGRNDERQSLLVPPEKFGAKEALNEPPLVAARVTTHDGETWVFDHVYELSFDGSGLVTIPAVLVRKGSGTLVQLNLITSAPADGECNWSVSQRSGRRVVGGSTFIVRTPADAKPEDRA
jgi:hypothetical protein